MRQAMLAAALTAATAGPALAGPLLIGPTTVQFAPGRRSAVVEVTNQSAGPATLQFRAFAWSQVDGRDRLAPAADLVVSPPIVVVAPHAMQVFRVLDSGAPGASERSYRLTLNELPGGAAKAVAINVEFSLPVFITPAGASSSISARVDGDAVSLVNAGTRHVRLDDLAVRDADGAGHALVVTGSAYLLAGTTRRFVAAPGRRPSTAVRVTGTSDAGAIDVPLATLAAR